MTWTAPDESSDREEVRAARSVRVSRLRRTLASALVGALLLSLVGALIGVHRDAPVSASALVQTSADPSAVEEAASGASGGDAAAQNDTYLETELVTLQGDDLAEQVAKQVGGAAPDLAATRVGNSNVVQITTTNQSAQTAVAQVQAAADLYVADRQARLTARITEQTTALDAQIATTSAALDALPRITTAGVDTVAQQRTALATQYTDQLATRDALQRAAADASSVAGIVQRATSSTSSKATTTVLLLIAGLVVGGLLGAAVPALISSLGTRLRDEKDVADLGAPLLSPALPGRLRSSRHSGRLERAVQLQALALSAGPSAGGSVAFVSATGGVGTSFAALQHARHAARHRPVLLISASDGSAADLRLLGVDPSARRYGALLPEHGGPVDAAALRAVTQPTGVPDLSVLMCGTAGHDDLTATVRLLTGGLVESATAAGFGVVVDAAPLDSSDIGLLAARHCAETVVVAGVRRSRADDVERTLRVLRSAGVTLTGVIVTNPTRARRSARSPGVPAPVVAAPATEVEQVPAAPVSPTPESVSPAGTRVPGA